MSERITTKHDIQRDEENSTRPNFSVVNQILVTGSMYMAYNGYDPGTGKVTLFISGSGVTNGNTHNHISGSGGAIVTPEILGAHALSTGIAASTTNWMCPNVTGLQASETALLITVGGALKNLYIRIGSTQPASGTLVCTLRINNADTALVITIPAGSLAGNYSDTTHTVALIAGDRVGFKIVNNATATSGIIGASVVELDVNNV